MATTATFNSSHSWFTLTHISMSCSGVGIIDPEQLLEWVLSFFICSVSRCHAWRRLPTVAIYRPAAVQQKPSQMKFSPSQETLSPFVFIILTRLFKELSSPASPARLGRLSHPSHHRHLFGAHPGRGAAVCFSHSSLPQKMCRRVGGDEERHFLTKINRHLPSLLYIYLQWVRRLLSPALFWGLFSTWLHHNKISSELKTHTGKLGKDEFLSSLFPQHSLFTFQETSPSCRRSFHYAGKSRIC